jgi:uncharacterized protein YlxW (UPF0749 family)
MTKQTQLAALQAYKAKLSKSPAKLAIARNLERTLLERDKLHKKVVELNQEIKRLTQALNE